jgi:hypothetical protein
MGLKYGQKWAIYMLLMKHDGNAADTKSQFRTDVDNDYNNLNLSYHDAIVKEATAQIDNTIQDGNIGQNIPDLTAGSLRTALQLDGPDMYMPNGNPCPDTATINNHPVDHQKAIVTALLGMTAPV